MDRTVVRQMDVWRLDSSRVLVVRAPGASNLFCRVSMGTGEQSLPETGKELFDHLVRGKNRLNAKYSWESNLAVEFSKKYAGFGPFAPLVVCAEEEP